MPTGRQEWVQTKFVQILMMHLEPSKVMKFWVACKLGQGDYIKLKDQTFENETVASLYEKIKGFQDSK
ncbi:MAG: hypothetical protein KME64_20130 [Scytonematopsis contorta HA4267-MV1]|jgi:hypothetical protein|nr:hypothetical protein [Scytonematopsis contorta HA4267-MV1]